MTKTNMYYEENPDSAHDIHELKVTLLGQHFSFLTDSGVFSKKMIDYGSQVLLNAVSFEAGKTLLDLGCGYGPLGIALAKVQGVKPTMVDVNNRALDLARKNAEKNGISATIFQSNVYEQVEGIFDYIITNPPIRAGKDVIRRFLFDGYDYLEDDGVIYFVMRKDHGVKSMIKELENKYMVNVIDKDKGFYVVELKKCR